MRQIPESWISVVEAAVQARLSSTLLEELTRPRTTDAVGVEEERLRVTIHDALARFEAETGLAADPAVPARLSAAVTLTLVLLHERVGDVDRAQALHHLLKPLLRSLSSRSTVSPRTDSRRRDLDFRRQRNDRYDRLAPSGPPAPDDCCD